MARGFYSTPSLERVCNQPCQGQLNSLVLEVVGVALEGPQPRVAKRRLGLRCLPIKPPLSMPLVCTGMRRNLETLMHVRRLERNDLVAL